MDNASRSERSRNALLEAALAVIARDGPSRLTLDAIARQSGISKGGLMHQFGSKEAVLRALVERQVEHFKEFTDAYLAEHGAGREQPGLAAQIATLREAIGTPSSVVFAILGAAVQEPGLLDVSRDADLEKMVAIRAEASDPELSMLRWFAAWGLTLTSMLGMSPVGADERDRLFDRLLDEARWPAGTPAAPTVRRAARRKPG